MNDTDNDREDARLRQLLDEAAALPREVAPPAGAWDAVRARIEAGRVRAIAPAATVATPRRFRWWRLAAAATILVTIAIPFVLRSRGKGATLPGPNAGAGAVVSVPVPTPPDVPPNAPPAAKIRALTSIPAALASNSPVFAASLDEYRRASRELEAVVAESMAGLPPSTREVVRRSLATIDSALADLRIALGHDPANAALGQYLTAVYEQKLNFLKRVRELPGAGL